jgi:hypothetical protein
MTRPFLLALFAAATFLAPGFPAVPQDEKEPKKDDYKEKTSRHKEDVVRIRGLEFKSDVAVGAYSKKELLDFLKAEFEKDLPREKADRYQRGYAKFGLIPPDLDIYEAYLELFGSSIAGFYHPKTKELRLIKPGEGKDGGEEEALKAMGIDMERITLVHELTHAAQDQNFELSTLPIEDETNDDLVMALKSVIEGDASAVGWKYQFKDQFEMVIGSINQTYKSGMLPGAAGKLPAYLRQSLTFPYGYGTDFVVKYLKGTKSEFKDINKLFKDFPLSSEQILHPDRYYGEKRDNPILVKMPDLTKLFGGPWKESFNNVHGEFATKLLLREFKSDKLRLGMIDRAAEGWGGDRYVVMEDDKKTAMYVWYTTWDTEKDAKEFYEAYCLALEKKYDQEMKEERGDKTAFATASGLVHVEIRGKDVLVFDGATQGMIDKAGAIWSETKKTEMTGVERLRKFVCEKDGVKEAFSGKCPKCGKDLVYKDEEKAAPEKKKREYKVGNDR